jgi:hypothetical protein
LEELLHSTNLFLFVETLWLSQDWPCRAATSW